MISKDYSSIGAPSGFRLLKQGEDIRRGDIYYAEVQKINPYKIEAWRDCSKVSIGKKFNPKVFMPVARRI